jgi:hypothetical protein
LKRSNNFPILQTKYGSSVEDTFYSPIGEMMKIKLQSIFVYSIFFLTLLFIMSVASPTIEYSELNKTPDMNDGYKPCGSNSNGDERR